VHNIAVSISFKQQQEINNTDKDVHFDRVQVLRAPASHVFIGEETGLEKQWSQRMKKLVIEVKVIADGMVHHVTKAFVQFQVFLAAVMAIVSLNDGAAVQTIIFVAVMLFH